MKKLKSVLLTFLISLVLVGCGKEPVVEKPVEIPEPPKEPVVETTSLSVIGVGDALIHNGIYIDANTYQVGADGHYIYDFTKMFTHIKEVIAPYDLKFYNQETVIGGKNLGLSNYPNFNSPDEIGLDLVKTGFNMVNLASNHTLDKFEAGATYSANMWKNVEGVYAVGNYASQEERDAVRIEEKNGITYTLLGYTYGTNGIAVPYGKDYLVNLYSDEKAKADIEKVRDKVDIVMVSMHWGTEYTHVPTAEQRRQAEYLSSLGVDVIIGHHSHVIQPIEFVGDTLVIYSLGNFISAQDGVNKRVGMIAAFTINKTTTDGVTTDLSISDVKGDLIWTHRTDWYTNFEVIPFSRLNDNMLWGYASIYEQYKGIINQTNDSRIQTGFIG